MHIVIARRLPNDNDCKLSTHFCSDECTRYFCSSHILYGINYFNLKHQNSLDSLFTDTEMQDHRRFRHFHGQSISASTTFAVLITGCHECRSFSISAYSWHKLCLGLLFTFNMTVIQQHYRHSSHIIHFS